MEYCIPLFHGITNERIYLIMMDDRLKLLGTVMLGEGAANSVDVPSRKLVDTALRYGATNVVLAHNHPGGFALPSQADKMCIRDRQQAGEVGATLPDPVARELIERCGQDPYLLENEVAKLAALADYGPITSAMVEEAAVQNLEANVFSLMQLIAARNAKGACELVHKLLLLRQEPVGCV